jgi:thiamine-phosphate pyrophosphorylase
MNSPIDWSLYLVTDRQLSLGRSIIDVVESAVAGGVSVVQLREKDISTREFVELGQILLKILKPQNIPLIINDRLDVTLAIGADGLHIGQSDMHYCDARNILGEKFLLGLSVENSEQVQEALHWNLSYMALSPLFSTSTKTDTSPPWGLEGLKEMRPRIHCPLVVIGGIHPHNSKEILAAGADGLAVVSAICSAPSPKEASAKFRKIIHETKKKTCP